MSFAVHFCVEKCVDVIESRHPHVFVGVVEQGCTVFASSDSSQRSRDQGHVVKLPDVRRSVPWKCARLLSQCLNFNGFPLFDQLTDIMIETNAFTASSGGTAETN